MHDDRFFRTERTPPFVLGPMLPRQLNAGVPVILGRLKRFAESRQMA